MEHVRIVLADDHNMMREGLAGIVDATEGLSVVGQADTGFEAVRLTRELQPDLLVLDYKLPDIDGSVVLSKLRAAGDRTRVLVLTNYDNVHYAYKVMRLGASGFVVKTGVVDELVDAIRTVQSGGTYVSRAMNGQLAQQLAAHGEEPAELIKLLSNREFELLRHIGEGLSLQEAARAMRVVESTASTYRARLMRKLHLQNTAQIIRFAIEHGIVG